MLKRFYPDDYVDSAYEIPYEELYKKGYRGIVFDVDNTLVEHGAPVTERAVALLDRKSTRLNSSHPNPSRMPSSA